MNKFDMSAGTVTLDLLQLKHVIGCAMSNARNDLEDEMRRIRDLLEQANIAERHENKYENYIATCGANTHREWLIRSAKQYANAIEAYFHICEAIKREKVITE